MTSRTGPRPWAPGALGAALALPLVAVAAPANADVTPLTSALTLEAGTSAVLRGGDSVQLRSERDGGGDGDGRVYRISFTGTDTHGADCTGTVNVGVPHDQRGAAAVDSGAVHDSFG